MSTPGSGSDELCAQCWRRGTEAMGKQNWDYAIQMFGTCAKLKPEHLTYRQVLRSCTHKKYNDNKSGAGMLAKAKLLGIRGRIKKARSAKAWDEMDQAAEEGLLINPWDTGLNVELAESARQREYREIAEFAFKSAWEVDPKNKPLSTQFAEFLEEIGKYTDAVKVWEHIYRLDPNDQTAQRKITGLQAKQTTERGNYDTAESTREVMVGTGGRPRKAESVAPGESVEQDLKHAIRKEPDVVEHRQKLGAFYKRAGRLEEAHELFKTALEMSGKEGFRESMEDIELDMLRRNRDMAREAANTDGGENAKNNYRELEKELVKREVEVLLSREQSYPNDMRIKLDLAKRFMRFQKWGEAIPRLQKAAQDVRVKGESLARLGICFASDGKKTLARGQLERAIPELDAEKDLKLFLETHYLMATICQELGDKATAEKHFGEILVVDYEYRDAKDRLEQLQGEGEDS